MIYLCTSLVIRLFDIRASALTLHDRRERLKKFQKRDQGRLPLVRSLRPMSRLPARCYQPPRRDRRRRRLCRLSGQQCGSPALRTPAIEIERNLLSGYGRAHFTYIRVASSIPRVYIGLRGDEDAARRGSRAGLSQSNDNDRNVEGNRLHAVKIRGTTRNTEEELVNAPPVAENRRDPTRRDARRRYATLGDMTHPFDAVWRRSNLDPARRGRES